MSEKLDRLSQPKRAPARPDKKAVSKPAKPAVPKKEPAKKPVAADVPAKKENPKPTAVKKNSPSTQQTSEPVNDSGPAHRAVEVAGESAVGDATASPGAAEYVFFSVCAVSTGPGPSDREIVEFAAVVLDADGLFETQVYATLIKPEHPVSGSSLQDCGLSAGMLRHAPTFRDAADRVFGVLNGRVWAGSEVDRRHAQPVRDQFRRVGLAPPAPAGVLDTVAFVNNRSGGPGVTAAGLGTRFGLNSGEHRRALEDVRHEIELLKRAALAVLLRHPAPETHDASRDAGDAQTPRSSHTAAPPADESEVEVDAHEDEAHQDNGHDESADATVEPPTEKSTSPRKHSVDHGNDHAKATPGRRGSDAGVRSRSNSAAAEHPPATRSRSSSAAEPPASRSRASSDAKRADLPRSRSSSTSKPAATEHHGSHSAATHHDHANAHAHSAHPAAHDGAGQHSTPSLTDNVPDLSDLPQNPFVHRLHNPDEPIRPAAGGGGYDDNHAVEANPFGHRRHNPDDPVQPAPVAVELADAPSEPQTPQPASTEPTASPIESASPVRTLASPAPEEVSSPAVRKSRDQVQQSVEDKIAEKIRRIRQQQEAAALPGVVPASARMDDESF